MLSENIKKYRKDRKLNQEELAVKLCVVRQTLSKWENNLSVPDADQLIALAEILNVSVNDLLGTTLEDQYDHKDVAAELAKANEQIARYAENERLRLEAGRVRGLILWLTIIAIALMQTIRNEVLAIAISSILLVAVLIILYRNISLLSVGFDTTGKTGSIKAVTVFDIVLIVIISIFGILVITAKIHLSENQEALFASALITVFMVFVGIIAPRLPYNRHTGLRLPWTVQNEGAWNIAHKILGIISIPLGLAYMSLTFFVNNMETLTLMVVLIWIGVPGLVSFLYAYKK
ncbi:MAG: XRE family transcriptional regulator [Oscillospiraceae bacterium]|nr:XRE family transcriptional regulator [Oscillospiraceae bacterium]